MVTVSTTLALVASQPAEGLPTCDECPRWSDIKHPDPMSASGANWNWQGGLRPAVNYRLPRSAGER
jgi:hypothetical protein